MLRLSLSTKKAIQNRANDIRPGAMNANGDTWLGTVMLFTKKTDTTPAEVTTLLTTENWYLSKRAALTAMKKVIKEIRGGT